MNELHAIRREHRAKVYNMSIKRSAAAIHKGHHRLCLELVDSTARHQLSPSYAYIANSMSVKGTPVSPSEETVMRVLYKLREHTSDKYEWCLPLLNGTH